mmetsp:Transcript_16326/g.40124  ORF Transcript_16326/g.40124 Transcript_16326/m.40124 type:complete len:105 (+) Transcript_16326:112-426(+)
MGACHARGRDALHAPIPTSPRPAVVVPLQLQVSGLVRASSVNARAMPKKVQGKVGRKRRQGASTDDNVTKKEAIEDPRTYARARCCHESFRVYIMPTARTHDCS